MVVKREPGTWRVRNLCSKRTTKQSSSTYCDTLPHAFNYCLYKGGIYCKVKEAKWLSKLAVQPTHTHRHTLTANSSQTAVTVAFTHPLEVWALNNTHPYTQRWGKYLYHSGLWWHLGVWQCWDDLQIPAGKRSCLVSEIQESPVWSGIYSVGSTLGNNQVKILTEVMQACVAAEYTECQVNVGQQTVQQGGAAEGP